MNVASKHVALELFWVQFDCEQRIFINFRKYITRRSRARIRADSPIDSPQAELSRARLLSLTRRAREKLFRFCGVTTSRDPHCLATNRPDLLVRARLSRPVTNFATFGCSRREDARSIFDRRYLRMPDDHHQNAGVRCKPDRNMYVVYLCLIDFLLFAPAYILWNWNLQVKKEENITRNMNKW